MLKVCIILFIVGVLILSLHKGLNELMASGKRKMILYLLIVILVFSIVGLLSIEQLFSGLLLKNFIVMQILFFGLGIFQLYCMEEIFTWDDEHKIYPQLLFTFVAAIFGSIGFLLVTWYLGTPTFSYFFWTSHFSFFIGFFLRLLWQGTIEFPDPVFQKWFYPLTRIVLLPEADELRNPRIISLAFEKTLNAERLTVFKAKAPNTMSFGKFFFHFINDYNQRCPEATIAFKDSNNQPFGWYFYVKPNFWGVTRTINPELTIQANHIKDQSTLICKRIV